MPVDNGRNIVLTKPNYFNCITRVPMAIKPAGLFGQFMIVAFWCLVLAWAPALLTVTYLALTMLALYLIARSKGVAFVDLLGNNNWVFCAALSMMLISMLVASKNPYVPPTAWERLTGVPYNPYPDYTLMGKLNKFYFGDTFTNGWRSAAWLYALLTFIAIFISFTDDAIGSLKEKRGG
jgi:hypothetical protein